MRVRYQDTHRCCIFCDGILEEGMAWLAVISAHKNTNIQSACPLHASVCCRDMDCACRRCQGPREFPHEVLASDTRHQMAGPRPKCRSHKPDWSNHGNGSDRQTSRLRSHCLELLQSIKLCAATLTYHSVDCRINRGNVIPGIHTSDGWTKFVDDNLCPSDDVWRDAVKRGHSAVTTRWRRWTSQLFSANENSDIKIWLVQAT